MAEIGTDVKRAVQLLKAGLNVAIPTETVYGLAGIISSEKSIKQIFEIKKRPFTDPLIVHVASPEAINPLVSSFPPLAMQLFKAFCPGPLTILLPKSESVPDLVTNASPLVAIRIPAHPLCLQLLEELGEPVAAPSANPFGGISPTCATHVESGLGSAVPYILDGGPCRVGLESTIIKILPEGGISVLRQGGISEEELRLFADLNLAEKQKEDVVPGSMLSHYAPRKPLFTESSKLPEGKMVCLRFQTALEGISEDRQVILSPSGNLSEAARGLFAALHRLDLMEADFILAEKVPDSGLGRAINDRLGRASHRKPS
jgi:L-threonylcarbamoyladenylate synthase